MRYILFVTIEVINSILYLFRVIYFGLYIGDSKNCIYFLHYILMYILVSLYFNIFYCLQPQVNFTNILYFPFPLFYCCTSSFIESLYDIISGPIYQPPNIHVITVETKLTCSLFNISYPTICLILLFFVTVLLLE
jgi:hypothetical protein